MCCIYLYACYVYNYMYIYWNQVVFFCGVRVARFGIFQAQILFVGGDDFYL